MKTLLALAVGALALFSAGVTLAQNGNRMNGGVWGTGWMVGYGGIGMPILLQRHAGHDWRHGCAAQDDGQAHGDDANDDGPGVC